LGVGDWGLGIGDWGLGPNPNPQSPIPNPHKYIFLKSKSMFYKILAIFIILKKLINFKNSFHFIIQKVLVFWFRFFLHIQYSVPN